MNRAFLTVSGAAVLVISSLAAVGILSERLQAFETAEHDLANVSGSVEAHLRQVTSSIDRSLTRIAIAANDSNLASAAANDSLRHLVMAANSVLPSGEAVVIANADDAIVIADEAESEITQATKISPISDYLRSHPDEDFYAGAEDVANPGSGYPPPLHTLILARRLTNRDGGYAGLVAAFINDEGMRAALSRIDLGQNGFVGLVTPDGRVLFDYPRGATPLSRDRLTPSFPLGSEIGASRPYMGIVTFPADSIRRMASVHSVIAGTLSLVVGTSEIEIEHEWLAQSLWVLGEAAGAILLVLWGLRRLRRSVSRREQEQRHHMAKLNQLATAASVIVRAHDEPTLIADVQRFVRPLFETGQAYIALGNHKDDKAPSGPWCIVAEIQDLGSKPIGLISVRRDNGRPFNHQDRMMLDRYASILGAALVRIKLLAEAGRERECSGRYLSMMSDGMFLLSRDWRILHTNQTVARYLHTTVDAIVGSHFWTLFPDTRDSIFGRQYEKAIATGQPAKFRAHYAPVGLWADFTAVPDANGLTIFFKDVTALVQAEDRLLASRQMEGTAQLMAGLAHDVHELLAVASGSLEMLSSLVEESDGRGSDASLIEDALDASHRASDLSQRMRSFASVRPAPAEQIDSVRHLAAVDARLSAALGDDIALDVQVASDAWPVTVAPGDLDSALDALARNAREAMPKGGALTIRVRNQVITPAAAETFEPLTPGDYLVISMADKGCGMSADVLRNACAPFFTTKTSGEHTGLGLSLVDGFARRAGGCLRLASALGKGTSVDLYLPRAQPVGPLVQYRTVRYGELEGGSETILLVEPSDPLRRFTEGFLRELGYTVLSTHDEAGVSDLLRSEIRPKLLLIDTILVPAGTPGREIAARVARHAPGLRVMFFTRETSPEALREARRLLHATVISKPFDPEQFAQAVRRQILGEPWGKRLRLISNTDAPSPDAARGAESKIEASQPLPDVTRLGNGQRSGQDNNKPPPTA